MPERRTRPRKFRPTIRLTVVSIFCIATLVTAALAVGLQYYFTRNMATDVAVNRFDGLAESTGQMLTDADARAVATTRILASYPGLVRDNWVNPDLLPLFAALMRDRHMLYAIYVGFENGDFFEVINLDSGPAVRDRLHAEAQDRWAVIRVRDRGQARRQTLTFYSADLEPRSERRTASNFDATTRPWFMRAGTGRVHKTDPYLFHYLQAPGQTYSMQLNNGAVVAVDVALSSVAEYLASRRLSDYGQVFLYRASGELIASNDTPAANAPLPAAAPLALSDEERALVAAQDVLKVSNEMDWAPIDFTESGQPRGYSIDYLALVAQMTGLRFEYVNGLSWPELVAQYKAGQVDMLQSVVDNGQSDYPGSFSTPYLDLPYSLVTRPRNDAITHIQQLRDATVAVPEGWSIIGALRRQFRAIHIKPVASTRAVLETVATGEADAGLDLGEILHYTGTRFFYQNLQYHDNVDFAPARFPTGLHLLLPDRHRDLLPLINRAIKNTSDSQRAALADKWFDSNAMSRSMLAVPYPQLLELARSPADQRRLVATRINGERSYLFVTPFGADEEQTQFLGIVIPVESVVRPALDKVRLSVLMTVAFLLLLIPAPWIFASPIVAPIKKLADENRKIRQRRYDELNIPRSYIREIDDLGYSMKEMVAAIQQHEANQIALMDSFIELIAQAIDDKSHYTAGHCERVPELAIMLVEKAHASQAPAFRDFSFHSEDERREFRVGAWLHDCGKITTPEHIVDKGSKLETIYNRIHEVRTRFEVLWRDADITYWQQMAEDPAGQETYLAQREATRHQLQDDFAFIAAMNVGGEFLSEDKKQRLRQLAAIPWTRHFSDRLGLSPVEEQRLSGDEAALPCTETLLANKPEHIIPREHDVDYDPRLGIKMEIPRDLYNQGEIYNLEIERGTLTAEDRFKINEHIISTIRMLDALPFPEELSRVPRYASTHHETLKGTGYPRRLTGDQLSIPERIMVLADIFEALTAADRPYKKAKPVSVAIDILDKMVADDHIDRAVFELFLTSGVYRDYAARFLPAEQLDAVDIDQYLRKAG